MLCVVFPAGIQKALDTPEGRDVLGDIGIDVQQDVAVIFQKQAGSLDRTHIIIGVKWLWPLDLEMRELFSIR